MMTRQQTQRNDTSRDAQQNRPTQIALWRQLQETARVIQAVSQGSSAPTAMESIPEALRAGVQALSYQVLRRLGVARWLRAQLVRQAPRPEVDALLCSTLALAWKQDEFSFDHVNVFSEQVRLKSELYSDFTLVNQAVEAARRHPRTRHQAGLVNACLRKFLREQDMWQKRCRQISPKHRSELLNLPTWWWNQLQVDYPQQCEAIALTGQMHPPMHLRVNARHMTPAQYLQECMLPVGMSGMVHGAYGVLLEKPCPVQQLPGFTQGLVSVQDAAAQLAAPLLLQALRLRRRQPQETLRLLDACAAPGGKTAQLLELGDHAVTALEIDAQRCVRIHETLERIGLKARVCNADALQTQTWWDGKYFDGILLDAPCSASGIVRRHPDIAWLRNEQDIARLACTQKEILDALWPLLSNNGVLLYCTCSVFHAEAEAQIAAFLLRHNDVVRLPAPGQLLPKQWISDEMLGQNEQRILLQNSAQPFHSPPLLDHDGFYYALLAKNN